MSVTGNGRGIGIPVILIHDSEGACVTVELKDGNSYCGILEEAQDNMNCMMKKCLRTHPDGTETQVEMAYIRGSQVRFIVVPDMLKIAPYFGRIETWRKYKGNAVLGAGGAVRGFAAKVRDRIDSRQKNQDSGGGSGGGAQRPCYEFINKGTCR